MKPQEQIANLEKENSQLKEQVAGLLKRVKELEGQKGPSKSRQQAEQGLKMLQAGPVRKEEFAKINPKYPSDVVYYIRTILKVDVKRVGSAYMLPEHHATYVEGLEKEKATQKAQTKAAVPPKEALLPIPQAQVQTGISAVA